MNSREEIREIRRLLLGWYDEHRRDLPWRVREGESPDPYRIWLSEVMLQQTRVETVRGYYERWLERFPTLTALAEAPLDGVLKQWEGLGYYSRARNLHRAAREVAERHGGEVPDDPERFRALPGVGRYTAGAVMSIAFGREEPVVDGNVRRVLSRWLDEPELRDAELWTTASALVPGERPGDLNQALMELGATVCTPRSPECPRCPVREQCAAYAAGTQELRPLPKRAKPLPHEHEAVAVIERGEELLLARRPVDARLGGLWEFPSILRRPGESAAAAAERAALEGVGVEARVRGPVGTVEHGFTHVKVTYEALRCEWVSGETAPLRYDACVWVTPDRISEYALPLAQKRIAGLALEPTLFG
jgi:A/G-specific adenine glycosylase